MFLGAGGRAGGGGGSFLQIQVGDLILIKNREPVPCDVLIMGVNEPNLQSPSGIAYVETKSLDGETNLKIRQVGLAADLGSISARPVNSRPV